MLAFAIVDLSSPDFQDPYGRPLEEYFEIDIGLKVNEYGTYEYKTLETHKCTDEDMDKFYDLNADQTPG